MLKVLASRFANHACALVTPEKTDAFEQSLSKLATMKDVEQLFSDSMAAASADFWMSDDNYLSRYRPYIVKNGILCIPIKGALLSDFPWATSWATGYEYIWEAFKRGQGDVDVKGIALIIMSPGGEVTGNFELVDRMFAYRGQKPVQAFAHEYAYSAAYSIASVADKITVSKTGGVGSIGVVTSHVDVSKMMEDVGYKITFIHFGAHKVDGNPYEPLPAAVKARIQSRIDTLGEVFVATVARNRGMDVKAVRDTEALTYTASEAIEIGLADAVGPLDEALAAYVDDIENANEGDDEMSDKTVVITQADVDSAKAAGVTEGKSAGMAEGQKAERTRIQAILGSPEGKKRPKAALSAALRSDMSVEAATEFLADLAEEAPVAKADDKGPEASVDGDKTKADNKQNFNSAMETDKPEVGGDTKTEKKEEGADADSSDNILSLAAAAGIPGLRKRSA